MRYFITGLSFSTGFGNPTATIEGMRAGKSAIRRHSELAQLGLPSDLGARIPPSSHHSSPADWARRAIRECLGSPGPSVHETGLAATIGWEAWSVSEYTRTIDGNAERPPHPPPPGTTECQLYREFEFGGPLRTSYSACAASTQLMADAISMLNHRHATSCIVGGSDSRLHPAGIVGYARLGALADGSDGDPSLCCRPFDAGHSGFVIGEGAAFFRVQAAAGPHLCPSPPLAEILATASTCDAHRLTDPEASGTMIRECMELAIQRSGLHRENIDLISTHGTGTPANDRAEATALTACFTGTPHPPRCLALKSQLGHCAMASGAVELAATIAAVRAGFLPPVLNLDQPIPEAAHLPWVTRTGITPPADPVLLKNSFGFGGQNSCVIVRIHTLDASSFPA